MNNIYTKEEKERCKARMLREYDRMIEQIEDTMAKDIGHTFTVVLTSNQGLVVLSAIRTAREYTENLPTKPIGEEGEP